ncbi:MAG: type II CAAX endopeptidase family protein [Acidobacteriota bacterium]
MIGRDSDDRQATDSTPAFEPGPNPSPPAPTPRRRLHPLVRAFAYLFLGLGAWTVFVILASFVVIGLGWASFDEPTNPALLTAQVLATVPAIVVVCLLWRVLSGQSLGALGYAGGTALAVRELLVGLAMGVGLLLVPWVISFVLGTATVHFTPSGLGGALLWIPLLLIAAHWEEVLCRGAVQQDLSWRWPWLGLVLSSAFFMLLHAGNPGLASDPAVHRLALINIALAGLLLGAVFWHTRRLWLVTGLHLSWNWTQGCLFGIEVSGMSLPSVLETRFEGEGWLTGGDFGLEGSALTTATLVPALLIALYQGYRKRDDETPDDGSAGSPTEPPTEPEEEQSVEMLS